MAAIDEAVHVEITSRAAWRAWLAEHHADHPPIWLVTWKKHVTDKHVSWGEIVREAICFGWIDSRTRRVDDDRTKLYVGPRKPGSMWSALNKRIIAELESEGLLAPAGLALIDAAKANGSWTFLDDVEALIVPADLGAALDQAEQRTAWDDTPASVRKRALLEVKTAKREATRASRVARIVARLQAGGRPA